MFFYELHVTLDENSGERLSNCSLCPSIHDSAASNPLALTIANTNLSTISILVGFSSYKHKRAVCRISAGRNRKCPHDIRIAAERVSLEIVNKEVSIQIEQTGNGVLILLFCRDRNNLCMRSITSFFIYGCYGVNKQLFCKPFFSAICLV